MAKVEIENIRLAVAALTENVYAGTLEKDNKAFRHKTDVTSDFYKCVIDKFSGFETEITSSEGKKYLITVKEVPK